MAWDDAEIGIDWRVPAEDIKLSEKDQKHPKLKEVDVF
ncbi:MAG: hypothetical protein ACK5LR_02235 [Mangrovibacterium sp.]